MSFKKNINNNNNNIINNGGITKNNNIQNQDKTKEEWLYKTLAAQQQLKIFSGLQTDSRAENWLEMLCVYEEEWSKERLLKQAKALLRKDALTWFLALEGEEICNWDEFIMYFRKRYIKEKSPEEEYLKLFDIINRGPGEDGLVNFIYLLKRLNKSSKVDEKIIKQGVSRHVPEKDRRTIIESGSLLELVETIERNKIKSYSEIRDHKVRKSESGSQTINKQNKQQNIQCFICAGAHYANNCPKKEKVNSSNKIQSDRKEMLMVNLEVVDHTTISNTLGIIAQVV